MFYFNAYFLRDLCCSIQRFIKIGNQRGEGASHLAASGHLGCHLSDASYKLQMLVHFLVIVHSERLLFTEKREKTFLINNVFNLCISYNFQGLFISEYFFFLIDRSLLLIST